MFDTFSENPVLISLPHFLHGDKNLTKMIVGMTPDKEKHSSIVDVLPKYGLAMKVLAKLQLNVVVEKNDGFGWFDNINQDKIYVPVLWFEEGVSELSEVHKMLTNVRH